MGRELGRISGPLLASNLRRNGVDLAFENNLLLLDVTSPRVGINSLGPSTDLTIGNIKSDGSPTTSTIQTVNLISTDTSNIGNFVISSDQIQHLTSTIYIEPDQSTDPTVVTPGLSTAKLYFSNNNLISTVTDSDINISPSGTGKVVLANDYGVVEVTVDSDLHATGDVTWDGDIFIGNETTDVVDFIGEVATDILPQVEINLITPVSEPYLSETLEVLLSEDGETLYTDPAAPYYATTYLWSLGSVNLQWDNVWATTLNAEASGVISDISAAITTIGNFTISTNIISNPLNDISFVTTGTGRTLFNGVNYISGSSITNPLNSEFKLANTLNGYVKFTGNSGVVIPSGTVDNRPYNPQQGATRWNPDAGTGEVFNGTMWIPVGGTAAVLSSAEVQDTMWTWDIILG